MTLRLRQRSVRLIAWLLKPLRLARFPFFRDLYRRIYRNVVPAQETWVEVQGVKICVDPHDRGVGYQLFIGRSYEPVSTRLFSSLLEPGMVVLDLGANIGYYGLIAAQLVGPKGRVFCFEPEPENFALLEASARANGFEHLSAVPKACSNENSRVTLHLAQGGKGLHTIGAAGEGWGKLEVEAVRLDDHFADCGEPGESLRLDFIKMDIEGAEALALAGMAELLQTNPDCLLFTELNPMALRRNGTAVRDFLDQLESLGLGILKVVDEVDESERAMGHEELLALCERRPKEVKDWSCNVLLSRADPSL